MNSARVWNFNRSSDTYKGTKDMDILASLDGANYALLKTVQLEKGPGTNTDFSKTFDVSVPYVRYVKFDIKSNQDGWVSPGPPLGDHGNGFVGLAEVQFDGTPIPLITAVSATASSTWNESLTPPSYRVENIVDGSGLDYGGVLGAHSTAGRYTMWLDGSAKTQAKDTDPYLVFDLGDDFVLQAVRIWNYNETPRRGAKGVNILGSADGQNFDLMKTIELDEGPLDNSYDFSQIIAGLTNAYGVRYVKFDFLSNHDGAIFPTSPYGDDGYGFVALSEVQFYGLRIPEPSTLALAGMGMAILAGCWRRRRKE